MEFPYLYVSSPQDYGEYDKYFVQNLPFTKDELVEMSKMTLDQLKESAAKLSIADAAARSGK